MSGKYYVTTAIDYVNAEPHIGHAYQKIVADVLSRWHKLKGKDTWFLTGTDEHGQKIERTAKENNTPTQKFVDQTAKKFQKAWDTLNIKYNRFIRTTDSDHKKFVQEFIKKVNDKGDIYKGAYKGLYCVGCERFYTEKDLINKKCPYHPNKEIESFNEETYYFKMSKYQKKLLEHYKKHPEFILPKERRNEIINRVKQGLQDLSITRTSFSWGIPFPLDKKHITYVWFDALLNYLSGAGKNQKYWPADTHLLGKDNAWFHCVIWPAMLLSAGYKLPRTVFVHGFLTFNEQKISKSLGNVISPKFLTQEYGTDTIRYFAIRQIPFASGNDGNFSESSLINRHNTELANKLGNLVSRISALAEKYPLQKTQNKLLKKLNLKKIDKHFENYELDRALSEIFNFIDICNEYIQEKKPWKTKDTKILYELADSIKAITILLSPFIPETSEKIARAFKFEISYKNINKPLSTNKINKSEILFQKIEQKQIKKETKQETIQGIMEKIPFNEWEKIDLRVGQITSIEEIPNTDKLYKLEINLGKEKRTVCAGLKPFYKKEQLKNKKIILFTNLEPRKIKGLESQGMLLAAVNKEQSKVTLIAPESDIELGSRIM